MAKGSGIGELIGWGIAGLGVWWLGSSTNWFGLFGTTSTTSTTAATPAASTPAATVVLAGPVTPNINNSLAANVSINGQVTNLSCIPGSGCYNTSGQDVTTTLAALGVTPAQIYALMQAASAIQPAPTPPATTPPPAANTTPPSRPSTITGTGIVGAPVVNNPVVPVRRPIALGKRGVSGPMVYATQRNYVRRGSSY